MVVCDVATAGCESLCVQELQLVKKASETMAAFVTYCEGILVCTAPLTFMGVLRKDWGKCGQ